MYFYLYTHIVNETNICSGTATAQTGRRTTNHNPSTKTMMIMMMMSIQMPSQKKAVSKTFSILTILFLQLMY